MILRNIGVLFVHIPKAAGTTIERQLLGAELSYADKPNYEIAWGWCPERRVWMQHLTPQELVDLELVERSELSDLFKFTVVRNPFSRAVSDYQFLVRHLDPPFGASFTSMLGGTGRWAKLMTDRSTSAYRGDHLRKQVSYLRLDGQEILDHIGRTETIAETFDVVQRVTGRELDPRLKLKQTRSRFSHYSHFYSDREAQEVASQYAADLNRFGYEFDDRRNLAVGLLRPARRLDYQARLFHGWLRKGMLG